ncbi:MAG: hypothetical protein JXP34_02310 [Planctomycetes bacterium]|nr:hypothetical protein [Planctomycetota bacterium]
MSSSCIYELALDADGARILEMRAGEMEIPFTDPRRARIRSGRTVFLTFRRARTRSRARVRIGAETFLDLPPGRADASRDLAQVLRDEFGEVEIVVEETAAEIEDAWAPVLRATVEVQPPPDLAEVFDTIVQDLEEAHVGLAEDHLGHAAHRGAGRAWVARALRPQEDLARLEEIWASLRSALQEIGDQPTLSLVRTVRLGRWRPGDRCDARMALEMARALGSAPRPAGICGAPEKAWLRRSELTSDIAEHRHLRDGIQRLARWAHGLHEFCEQAAESVKIEEERWGDQVFEERYRPRIRQYGELAERGERLASEMRHAIHRHEFLRQAGPPRTPFGPTPVFLGRHAYRQAFRALRAARRRFGIQVDAEGEVRARLKRFSVLYEYWCFIRIVCALREHFGAPEGRGTFRLADDLYRPELAPGQSFRFRLPGRTRVTVTYEREFAPAVEAPVAGYAAALVTAPLRPDIVIEVRPEGHPSVMMVLDAKSTRAFEKEMLWRLSDYQRLVHDPKTGDQPIRQVVLLHADPRTVPLTNLPGYLEGRFGARASRILAAAPFLPGHTNHVEAMIERFFDDCGIELRS